MTTTPKERKLGRRLKAIVQDLREMPGGRELLENKKRRLAGVLKKGDNDDHLQRHE